MVFFVYRFQNTSTKYIHTQDLEYWHILGTLESHILQIFFNDHSTARMDALPF